MANVRIPTSIEGLTDETRSDLACEVLGLDAIARRLGLSRNTMWKIRERDAAGRTKTDPMPPPAGHVSGRPWWWSPEIDAWAEATGRPVRQPTERETV